MTTPRLRRLGLSAALAAILGSTVALAASASDERHPGGPGISGPEAGPGVGPGFGPGFGPGLRNLDFKGIDTDASGGLSRAELVDRGRTRLARADANGDGNLDRAELVAAMPAPGGPLVDLFGADRAEQRADALLASFGASEAGSVSTTVFAERRADMLLAMLDADRDGQVTEAELAAARERGPRHDRGAGEGPSHRQDGHSRR